MVRKDIDTKSCTWNYVNYVNFVECELCEMCELCEPCDYKLTGRYHRAHFSIHTCSQSWNYAHLLSILSLCHLQRQQFDLR